MTGSATFTMPHTAVDVRDRRRRQAERRVDVRERRLDEDARLLQVGQDRCRDRDVGRSLRRVHADEGDGWERGVFTNAGATETPNTITSASAAIGRAIAKPLVSFAGRVARRRAAIATAAVLPSGGAW